MLTHLVALQQLGSIESRVCEWPTGTAPGSDVVM